MDELEEYYRGYAQVDLDAVYHNTAILKESIAGSSNITAVIKADGYGHGAVPIARAIEELTASYAVATVQEGLNLREHGIEKPIYIIGYTHPSMFDAAIEQEIRLTVYDYNTAYEIHRRAGALGRTAYIHIKLDTGMSRIGFKDDSGTVEIIKKISLLENINMEGIFTHFSCGDMKDKTSANAQLKRFIQFIKSLKENKIHIPVIHCANSACILDMPETGYSTVRAGIALYGLWPSDEVNSEIMERLKPVLSLKSHIIQLKEVEAGTGIGYGASFITSQKTKVATVPIGYGDGYPRSLSNKGAVLVRGQKAPVIGRVCMDQIMLDVTEIQDVSEGDLVTLIGTDGKKTITVEELSDLAGTFNYEFVCDLGKRIPRVYYKGNQIVCKKDYFHDTYNIQKF